MPLFKGRKEIKKTLDKKNFSNLSTIIIAFVLVITAISTIFSTQLSSRIIRDEIDKNNTLLLNKIKDLVENKIFEIDRNIIRFCLYTIDAENVEMELSNDFNKYKLYNKIGRMGFNYEYIDSVYIFFNNGRSVYSYDMDSKRYNILKTREFPDTDVYEELIKSRRFSIITANTGTGQLGHINQLAIAKRLPLTKMNSKDSVVVNIKAEYLVELISDSYILQNSGLFVLDSQNSVIASTSNQKNSPDRIKRFNVSEALVELDENPNSSKPESIKLNDEIYYVTAARTEDTQRKYLLVTPKKNLLSPVRNVNVPIYILSNVILLLGIVFARYVERLFLKPVSRLIRRIRDKTSTKLNESVKQERRFFRKGNEMNQLAGIIDNIISLNEEQEKRLKDYFSYYKERVILSLMVGSRDESDNECFENRIFLQRKHTGYVVLTLSVKNFDMEDSIKPETSMDDILEQILDELQCYGQLESVSLNRSIYAILVCLDDCGDEIIEEEIENRLLAVISDKETRFIIGIGDFCSKPGDIRSSFAKAQKAVRCLEKDRGRKILKYRDITGRSMEGYNYPVEIEKNIYKALLCNDCEKVNMNTEIFLREMEKNSIGLDKAKNHVIMLVFTIYLKMKNENINCIITKTDLIEQMDKLNSYSDLEEWIKDLCARIINENNSMPEVNNNELIEKVCKYINTYYEEEICLNTVAEMIYLSPSYFGKLFKEYTDTTFTEYLINVRMVKAGHLLVNTDLKISQIINKVGYHSSQSFNKIFRGRYGCSPSDYRKKYAVNLLE